MFTWYEYQNRCVWFYDYDRYTVGNVIESERFAKYSGPVLLALSKDLLFAWCTVSHYADYVYYENERYILLTSFLINTQLVYAISNNTYNGKIGKHLGQTV